MGLLDRLLGRDRAQDDDRATYPAGPSGPRGTVQDPVCKMWVRPDKVPWHATHGTHTYHFCAGGCKNAFEADPHQYLGAHGH